MQISILLRQADQALNDLSFLHDRENEFELVFNLVVEKNSDLERRVSNRLGQASEVPEVLVDSDNADVGSIRILDGEGPSPSVDRPNEIVDRVNATVLVSKGKDYHSQLAGDQEIQENIKIEDLKVSISEKIIQLNELLKTAEKANEYFSEMVSDAEKEQVAALEQITAARGSLQENFEARNDQVRHQIQEETDRISNITSWRNIRGRFFKKILWVLGAISLFVGGFTYTMWLNRNIDRAREILVNGGLVIVVVVTIAILIVAYRDYRFRDIGQSFLNMLNGEIVDLETEFSSESSNLASLEDQARHDFSNRIREVCTAQTNSLIEENKKLGDLRTEFESLLQSLISLLNNRVKKLAADLRTIHRDWEDEYWEMVEPNLFVDHKLTNPGIRIGTIKLEDGTLSVPAVLDIIHSRKHIFIHDEDGYFANHNFLEGLLLRLASTFPPGSARFTLVDGLEQGRGLAAYATKLHTDIANGEVYVNARDIEQEIGRLRQKITQINHYVLVDFASIEEYNVANPEIPSTYNFLVIRNFPHGFSDVSLKELKDILRNGAQAGVFAIISLSGEKSSLHDFSLRDIEEENYFVGLEDGKPHWNSENFPNSQLSIDRFQLRSRIGDILGLVTKYYLSNPQVIDYERILGEFPTNWSSRSDKGINTAVGLTFGGKSQWIYFDDTFTHGLIGGRTGSGKTIFLHDVICGLTQIYSPDELEMYLLDFAGVEFNVYAKGGGLPHAKVVAVDCDVEVGLSVLEDLEQTMDRRRKLFSDNDVKDFQQYREIGNKLARIILIIDELQALTDILDMTLERRIQAFLTILLKEGRKFGIHLILGTQSPVGVLEKPMLEQIANRICLLSDRSVSSMVLGDTNEAAASLEKQGEAVFNAYNGNPERNVLMRAAYIKRERIKSIVYELSKLAKKNNIDSKNGHYFDGQLKPKLSESEVIINASRSKLTADHALVIPIGEPVGVNEKVTVELKRERYSNVIACGGHENGRHAFFINFLLAVATLRSKKDAEFFVVDLSHAVSDLSKFTKEFELTPHSIKIAYNSGEASKLLDQVSKELGKREVSHSRGKSLDSSIFLFMHGLENLSTIREDSLNDNSATREPFEHILSVGPSLGIHTIVTTQTLGRGEIIRANEFSSRICFQADERDSKDLLDVDSATRIVRTDRALFRMKDWGYGRLLKFIPFVSVDHELLKGYIKSLSD